jgi:hypothetical protein
MVYETDIIPSFKLNFDIDWRDLDKDNREYFKKKFVIADANKPMYVSFFNGNVSIVYKKEI